MSSKDYPRLIISAAILMLFGWAYARHPDNALLVGALIAMATQAVQYWLGSSKGSADKSTQLERQASGKESDPVHMVEEES